MSSVGTQSDAKERVYDNSGNDDLISLLDLPGPISVLDIGCGTGANAALIRARSPGSKIFGITASPDEAALAKRHMEQCWISDLEVGPPAELQGRVFDVLIFSHVLEHLSRPWLSVEKFSRHVRPKGLVLIAVPNILFWRQRVGFLFGRFEYTSHGAMDETHLRFFTYRTAGKLLFSHTCDLEIDRALVTGSAPLWVLRRYVLPPSICLRIDKLAGKLFPNLFGSQVLVRAKKAALPN